MPAHLPHRIRRLHWQARAPTAEAAFALRALLREASTQVLAGLEQSLSAHAPDGQLIHLPRLELHLRVDLPFAAQDLVAHIATATLEALGELRSATDPATMPPDMPHGHRQHAAAPTRAEDTDRILAAPSRSPDTLPAGLRAIPIPQRVATLARWLAVLPPDTRPELIAAHNPTPANALHPFTAALRALLASLPADSAEALHAQSVWLAWTMEPEHTDATWRSSVGSWRETVVGGSAAAALLPILREPAAHPGHSSAPAPGSTPAPARPGRHPEALPALGASALDISHVQALLTTYLLTGSLDWTLAGLESGAALQVLRGAAAQWVELGRLPPCVVPLPILQRIGALARWLALLPAGSRPGVVAAHNPAPANTQHPFTSALRTLLANLPAGSAEALHAQSLWLAWSIEPGHADTTWFSHVETSLEAPAGEDSAAAPWAALLATLPQPAAPSDKSPALPLRHAAPPQTAPETKHPGHVAERHAAGAPAGLVVPAAGLVLLHPYLPRLLDATGLYPAGSKGPIPDPALPRAAALLHWLANGHDVGHEFALPFIKLLLGRAPDEPLFHAPPALHDSERDEAGTLLDAVLTHWQALRGTSVDGLRSGFLQRRGWIAPRDKAWLLRVEPESFDMLLGLLPWGLGLVRLPWMTQPLFTEWSAP